MSPRPFVLSLPSRIKNFAVWRAKAGNWMSAGSSRGGDFEACVGVAPQKRNPREPVFRVDHFADAGKFFGRKNSGSRAEFGAGDFPADGARRNLCLRVIADALRLPGLAARHEVEFVVVFGKPDW